MCTIDRQLAYLLDKANLLSKPYDEQIMGLESLGDYLTDDIANDWMDGDIDLLNDLYYHKIVDKTTVDLYTTINNNFIDVSKGGRLFDKKIWTLDALKYHPFWSMQRDLSKKLVTLLNRSL